MNYDAIDSLIYLSRGVLLDYIEEQLIMMADGGTGDASLSELADLVASVRGEIEREMWANYDGRTLFSNGNRFERLEKYPTTEPDSYGNEVPVIGEVHVQLHPSGEPAEPIMPGGVFSAD